MAHIGVTTLMPWPRTVLPWAMADDSQPGGPGAALLNEAVPSEVGHLRCLCSGSGSLLRCVGPGNRSLSPTVGGVLTWGGVGHRTDGGRRRTATNEPRTETRAPVIRA